MQLPREVLEAEYLPLPVAALVAYYKVTDLRRQLPQEHIGETVRAMAVALSTVATIYGPGVDGKERCALTDAELDELLFRPHGGAMRPALDHLSIRKADMQRGIEALKASGGLANYT
ncbi:MAG TPA: hypothetical protein VH600_00800 [Burkholderiales bacterium]|jgi:hypothetical protein